MYVLIIDNPMDLDMPEVHGLFDTVLEAQEYARAYREKYGILGHDNVQPTSEEIEAWTNAGYSFHIFEPLKVKV